MTSPWVGGSGWYSSQNLVQTMHCNFEYSSLQIVVIGDLMRENHTKYDFNVWVEEEYTALTIVSIE